MTKNIIAAWLLLASLNIYAQTSVAKTQKGPFGIDWDSLTACSDFKLKYRTTATSRHADVEELGVVSPEKHFPGSDSIQVICVSGEIRAIFVRIPKIRTDGGDLAALYEELSRTYELDLLQQRQIAGNIKSTFKARGVRVALSDQMDSEYRNVTFER